jgi:hypothetical protein
VWCFAPRAFFKARVASFPAKQPGASHPVPYGKGKGKGNKACVAPPGRKNPCFAKKQPVLRNASSSFGEEWAFAKQGRNAEGNVKLFDVEKKRRFKNAVRVE